MSRYLRRMTQVWVAVATAGIPAIAGVLAALFRLQSRSHRELRLMEAEIEMLAKFPEDHPARESVSSSLCAHAAAYAKRSQPKVVKRDSLVTTLGTVLAGAFVSGVVLLLTLYWLRLIEVRQTVNAECLVTIRPDGTTTSNGCVPSPMGEGSLFATIVIASVPVLLMVVAVWVVFRQQRGIGR